MSTPDFRFRERPVHVPSWFLGIVDRYVPEDQRAAAIYDYGTAHAHSRRPLTARQREIYGFIASHIAELGYAPSQDEIAERFGFRSISTVHEHLANLVRKNWIHKAYNEARAITLVEVPA